MAELGTVYLWFGEGWVSADPLRSDARTAIVTVRRDGDEAPITVKRVQVLSPDTWENTRPDADEAVTKGVREWIARHQFYADDIPEDWEDEACAGEAP